MTIEMAVYDCDECDEESLSEEGARFHAEMTGHRVRRVKIVRASA